ncbi:MAG: DUF5011 domain-containing protein, partial [Opitutae bacterium]|nr:DUF5011 domain-containing protein [Opitutae bacterium]
APVLALKGSATSTVFLGKPYVDAGATATDSFEGDLSTRIILVGTVDTSVEGVYTLTYNVSDTVGNAATEVTRKVTVTQESDVTNPVITLLGGVDITTEGREKYVDPGVTAGDDRDGDLTVKVVTGGDEVDTAVLGVYNITYDVTDAAGNKAVQIVRKVTVVDTTAPLVVLNGASEVIVEGGEIYTDAGGTSTDSFDGDVTASITVDNPVNTSKLGDYLVTFTAKDVSNNQGAITRKVSVVDTTAPVITLAGGASVTIASGSTFIDPGATAVDIIDGDVTSEIVADLTLVDTSKAGTYKVTYNVSDSSGNTAVELSRNVIVSADVIAPVITLVGDVSVAVEIGNAYTDAGATALDNVDGDITSSIVIVNPVDTSKPGEYVVTFNVADAVGNKAVEVMRIVTVADTVAPVITVVGDTVTNIEAGEVYTDAGATAVDEFEGDLTASIVTTGTVDSSSVGEYTVSYNVTDSSGNKAVQVSRKVTVADTIAPVITLNGDVEMVVEVKSAFEDPGATVVDAYEGDLIAKLTVAGTVDTDKPGEYTLLYKASDSAGNEVQVSRKVTVSDTGKPILLTLIGPRFVTLLLDDTYTDLGAIALDAYEGNISAKVTVGNPVDTSKVGEYSVTYNVSDTAGNSANPLVRTVRVVDPIPPVLSMRGLFAVKLKKGDVYLDSGAMATDNYDGNLTDSIITNNPVDTSKTGIYSVTYIVKDTSGNEVKATRTVIVASEPQGYVDWLTSSGLDKLPMIDQVFTADPDKDGTNNLLEYFFGGSPISFDHLRPSLNFDPATGDIAFSFRKRKGLDPGWNFEILRRQNFNATNVWADALKPSGDFPIPEITNMDNGDDTTTETYTFKAVGSLSSMYFLQLVIDYEE